MSSDITVKSEPDVADGPNGGGRTPPALYRPDTDIYETTDNLVIVTDLCGIGPNDVDVTLNRRVLTIAARAHANRPEGYRLLHAEYGEGDFERSFVLSEEIDGDQVDASHKNGVLTLTLAKADSAKPRRVEVRAD